jgi:ligand-binding sensor domain-containing protein
LWVGFDRMRWGLSVFDGQTWQTSAEWNRDAVLYTMTFAADGQLWASGRFDSPVVGESDGFLAAFDGGEWAWRPVLPDWPFGARDLAAAPDGTLWVAVDGNRGLQVVDVGGGGLGREAAYYPEQVFADPVAVAPDGRVWASNNFRTKLLVFDGQEWRYQPIPLSALVSAIAPAPDGSLWVGTNRGAARLAEGTWQTFRSAESLYGRPKGAAAALAVASDGALWAGASAGGVARYSADHARLNTYPAALARFEVRSILSAADGSVWVATAGGGIGRYDGAAWEVFTPDSLLTTARVRALAVAADGSAWLATASGAVRITETNCAFDPRWRSRSNALAVEAAPDGVWIATRSAGAMLWSQEDGSLFEARQQTGSRVNALDVAPDGSAWFAGEEAAIGYLAGEWQRLAVDADLAEGGLTAILYAPDRTLWIGTRQGAAYREGRNWRVLTPADGLADPHVQYIAAAPDGSIWFATPGGLSRYNP